MFAPVAGQPSLRALSHDLSDKKPEDLLLLKDTLLDLCVSDNIQQLYLGFDTCLAIARVWGQTDFAKIPLAIAISACASEKGSNRECGLNLFSLLLKQNPVFTIEPLFQALEAESQRKKPEMGLLLIGLEDLIFGYCFSYLSHSHKERLLHILANLPSCHERYFQKKVQKLKETVEKKTPLPVLSKRQVLLIELRNPRRQQISQVTYLFDRLNSPDELTVQKSEEKIQYLLQQGISFQEVATHSLPTCPLDPEAIKQIALGQSEARHPLLKKRAAEACRYLLENSHVQGCKIAVAVASKKMRSSEESSQQEGLDYMALALKSYWRPKLLQEDILLAISIAKKLCATNRPSDAHDFFASLVSHGQREDVEQFKDTLLDLCASDDRAKLEVGFDICHQIAKQGKKINLMEIPLSIATSTCANENELRKEHGWRLFRTLLKKDCVLTIDPLLQAMEAESKQKVPLKDLLFRLEELVIGYSFFYTSCNKREPILQKLMQILSNLSTCDDEWLQKQALKLKAEVAKQIAAKASQAMQSSYEIEQKWGLKTFALLLEHCNSPLSKNDLLQAISIARKICLTDRPGDGEEFFAKLVIRGQEEEVLQLQETLFELCVSNNHHQLEIGFSICQKIVNHRGKTLLGKGGILQSLIHVLADFPRSNVDFQKRVKELIKQIALLISENMQSPGESFEREGLNYCSILLNHCGSHLLEDDLPLVISIAKKIIDSDDPYEAKDFLLKLGSRRQKEAVAVLKEIVPDLCVSNNIPKLDLGFRICYEIARQHSGPDHIEICLSAAFSASCLSEDLFQRERGLSLYKTLLKEHRSLIIESLIQALEIESRRRDLLTDSLFSLLRDLAYQPLCLSSSGIKSLDQALRNLRSSGNRYAQEALHALNWRGILEIETQKEYKIPYQPNPQRPLK